MGADQKGWIHRGGGGSERFGLGLTLAVQDGRTAAECDKPKSRSPDQESAAVHMRFPLGKMRQARIAAKAASDR